MSAKDSALTIIQERISFIEKQMSDIRENQKKIEAKNTEIVTELNNLRIWIRRR